jgi:exodeoxyribonuclease-1
VHARSAAGGPDFAHVWAEVFKKPGAGGETDVDEDLYGGFVGNGDRRKLDALRGDTPEKLAAARPSFEDERLEELFFRYRARNFPHTLSADEARHWEEQRAARLFDGAGGARTIEQLFGEIDALSETADERAEEILGALYDYAEMIAPSRQ